MYFVGDFKIWLFNETWLSQKGNKSTKACMHITSTIKLTIS